MGCCNIKINVKTRPIKLGVSTKLMATGKQAYPSTVELDMVDGDQILEPIEGKVFSKVTVKKPDTLVAENIRKDINIGGVVGSLKPYVPVVSSELNVEPKTEVQIFTPAENEYYDKVNVDAVTSSIDSNIVPENIRNNVEILGVKGTMLPKGLDAMQWKCDNMKTLYQEFMNYTGTSLDEPLTSLDTSKVADMRNMFYGCVNIITIPLLDMINVTSMSGMFTNCRALTNLTLKNIKRNLIIGSGTNWGHLLTVDSLVNTIKELWDYSSVSSNYTLSMGSANLTKIANIYVKLITPTQEQIETDPYINNKKPCEVCESTDEGAMTITAYANLKHWTLA